MSLKSATKIGIIAGSFKPFHKGHYELIKHAAAENDIVELFVSLSTRSRPGELIVRGEEMEQIWKNFIEPFLSPNVVVNYVQVPIRSAYEFMQEKEEQNSKDVLITLYSDSDDMSGNFPLKNLEKYMPTLLKRKQIKIKSFDRENFVDASGTAVRKAILANDKRKFMSMMPAEIDRDSIWNLLTSQIEVAPEKIVKKKSKLSEGLVSFEQYLSNQVISILVSNYAMPAGDITLEWEFTDALPDRVRGRYVIKRQKLLINSKKSKEQFKSQVRTILHEIQHWNQHATFIEASDSIQQSIDRFSGNYKISVARNGYWDAPEEVEAREFAEENLQDAMKLINDHYTGKDVGMTPDDVVEELFDLYERDPSYPITRFLIGTSLSDYSLNNKENLNYVINSLKELEVKIT